MAERTKKKRRWVFPLVLTVYAILFLGATAYGLNRLWDFMDAYECSRPYIAVDGYMAKLDADYVCDASAELIGRIDHHVQSEEACRQVIREAVAGGISCAKRSAECTDDRLVYVLRSGGMGIGEFQLEHRGETRYGYTPWEVTGDSFDLAFLLTDPVTVTVPEHYPVFVNGNQLSDDYITESGIHYPALEGFYEDYTLPCMVTYQTGPFLGDHQLQVTDLEGNPVTIDETTDMNAFADNCAPEEIASIDTAADGFIRSYIEFTSCTGNDTYGNYNKLAAHMVPGGELAKRMKNAIDGLYWVSDRGASLASITVNHYVNLGGGRYLCDLTYVVDTRDFSGAVQTTANLKLILLQTDNGLKAESMLSY